MTNEQKIAYLNAMACSAVIEATGMAAENTLRVHRGEDLVYTKESFDALIHKYGINPSAIVALFQP